MRYTMLTNYLADLNTFKNIQTERLLTYCLDHYLTPTTILDLFMSPDRNEFTVWELQLVAQSYTDPYFIGFWESVKNFKFVTRLNADLAFITTEMFSGFETTSSTVHRSISNLAEELHFLGSPKTLAETLNEISPEDNYFWELFEVMSVNIDNSLYAHLHLPPFKLHYPEPYIASPSFVHEELWFIHILHYQHWLWFFFISLIMFFFITFINVVRWCNPRNKPKRETRGVSRSKCADLITACVPVSWALSIIISESVDAADYYDGFGTGEIVVGIRAYQWGWEYFFPKNIDLNYNANPTYSSVTGNSLKYSRTEGLNSEANHMYKNMRLKTQDRSTIVPAHTLLAPSDNTKILDFMNFNSLGESSLTASSAFKKIQSASKTSPSALFSNPDDISLKYNKIYDLYVRGNDSQDGQNYGISRQHTYGSKLTTTNNFRPLLDEASVSKALDYNNRSKSVKTDSYWAPTLRNSLKNMNLNNTINSQFTSSTLDRQLIINLSKEFGSVDSKLEKGVGSKVSVDLLTNLATMDSVATSLDNSSDKNSVYREVSFKSPNQSVLSGDRTVRNIQYFNPSKTTNSLICEMMEKCNRLSSGNMDTSEGQLYPQSKILASSTVFPDAHYPTTDLGSRSVSLGFDRFTELGNNASLFLAKDELAPSFIFQPFWLTLWSSEGSDMRYNLLEGFKNLTVNQSLPTITEYSDYDFKNWTSLELLDDLFWESSFSSFTQDDYISLLGDISDYDNLLKDEDIFYQLYRSDLLDLKLKRTSWLRDVVFATNFNTLPLFSEDGYSDVSLVPLDEFNLYDYDVEFEGMSDSYNNIKFVNYIYHSNYVNALNMLRLGTQPTSYVSVLNLFRSNYDENLLSFDQHSDIYDSVSNYIDSNLSNDTRNSNPIKLRATAKNSIVTFNALQKVFRPRFDEGRSNVRFQDLSNTYVKYPYLSANRVSYENMLAKNTESFFNSNVYKSLLTTNYTNLTPVFNSLNTYFSTLPFLTAMQSDAIRYLWFDWQSRWSSIEVQPSSVARYSLMGIPYSNKYFEYNTQLGDSVNDSETYLTRLGKARKNYMSNWALTPYLYSRISNWYGTNSYGYQAINTPSITNLRLTLVLASKYWGSNSMSNLTNIPSPTLSDVNTPGRSSWRPFTGVQSSNYNLSILSDLLTKREYLYREYFLNKGFSVNLPKYLLATPSNSLYQEVKKSYSWADPSSFMSEVSRDYFYENTNLFRFQVLVNLARKIDSVGFKDVLNLSKVYNYAFFYLLNTDSVDSSLHNKELYKNQFRPLRKGVSNMIRLHATGAVAMPIEIRLHILASSRDIIHSWAIPSAGIKIDCVPGYSSHRVAIFLVSGIFWGQCMEICGRFHHWMPIIVYFMKKDLFFLWCTHFIHFNPNNSSFQTSDKEFTDKLRVVSYDPSLWVKGVIRSL